MLLTFLADYFCPLVHQMATNQAHIKLNKTKVISKTDLSPQLHLTLPLERFDRSQNMLLSYKKMYLQQAWKFTMSTKDVTKTETVFSIIEHFEDTMKIQMKIVLNGVQVYASIRMKVGKHYMDYTLTDKDA